MSLLCPLHAVSTGYTSAEKEINMDSLVPIMENISCNLQERQREGKADTQQMVATDMSSMDNCISIMFHRTSSQRKSSVLTTSTDGKTSH